MRGGTVQFFADKPINVVMPVGGPGSFYTDGEKDDPTLGHNRRLRAVPSSHPARRCSSSASDSGAEKNDE